MSPSVVAAGTALVLWAAQVPVPARGRLDAVTPFVQATAIRPQLALLAVLAGAVGLVLVAAGRIERRRRVVPLAVALVAGLTAAADVAPRAFGDPAPPPSGAPVLTVVAANTRLADVEPDAIVDVVRGTEADALALPETSRGQALAYGRALTRAGLGEWRAFDDDAVLGDPDTPGPTALLARAELRPRLSAPPDPSDLRGEVAVALRAVEGAPVVVAVHPVAPTPGAVGDWRDDLLALRAPCRDGAILAGDFNATLDHSPLRELLDAGCEAAADAAGQGLVWTWSDPVGVIRPAIDHVLVGGRWTTVAAGVLDLPGSDHRAVWARVAAE